MLYTKQMRIIHRNIYDMLILLSLSLFPCIPAFSADYAPEIKSEFQSFFAEAMPNVIQAKKVHLITESIYENPDAMPISVSMPVDNIEKVLILFVPHNGYSREGLYFESCEKQNLFIMGIEIKDPTISELKTHIRTPCHHHQLSLLVWVKTRHGYYQDSASFNTTAESPGE